jgi:hypothetical protein
LSLVRELETPDGRIRGFFEQRFRELGEIKSEVRQRAAGVPLTRPDTNVPWGTVGQAIDYRITFSFAAARELARSLWGESAIAGAILVEMGKAGYERAPMLPAEDGAILLIANRRFPHGLVRGFFESLRRTLAEVAPRGMMLDRRGEETLCRHCYVLGLFDEISRAGLAIRSPLHELRADAGLDELLGLASDTAIADVCNMAELFCRTQRELVAGDAVFKPTFSGSNAIGGADADLTVDRCLIEVKATINPGKIGKASWPWQLLGYALLDLDNRYELSELALYLARQGLLLRWPVDEYASRLAGVPTSIAAVRRAFRDVLIEDAAQ